MEKREYSVIYRIMHWAIALCLLFLLLTIFLRSTWLNKNHVAAIIGDYLATTDASLSQDQMIALAKKIRKPMWNWHIYTGYVLVGLFAIRMALPLLGLMKFANPSKKGISSFTRFQYWVYLIFYGCLLVSLVTGLLMEFGPREMKKPMESIHVLSVYYLLAYIIIHMGGVFLAEFSGQQGIISRIISGKKKV